MTSLKIKIIAALSLLSACATVPASDSTLSLRALPSIEQEKAIGRNALPSLVASLGGSYRRGDLEEFLEGIAARLAPFADLPPEHSNISVTVLDTAEPNAFAVIGGELLVSRGMVAYANSVDELAGVIAHELGHVGARHTAQRLVRRDLFSREIAALQGAEDARNEQQQKLDEFLRFSREQELEADRLGVRILADAGYDPTAFASLLGRLSAYDQNRLQSIGVTRSEIAERVLASGYPQTSERFAAIESVMPEISPLQRPREQDALMAQIDGLSYERKLGRTFIRDGMLWNPFEQTVFEVPEDFVAVPGKRIMLVASNGAVFSRSDAKPRPDAELTEAFSALLSRGVMRSIDSFEVNGIKGVRGTGVLDPSRNPSVIRLAVFETGRKWHAIAQINEFFESEGSSETFDKMIRSFRRVGPGELASERRFRTRRVQPDETVSSLIAGSAFDENAETDFRLLNGLREGEDVIAGQWIKLVQ